MRPSRSPSSERDKSNPVHWCRGYCLKLWLHMLSTTLLAIWMRHGESRTCSMWMCRINLTREPAMVTRKIRQTYHDRSLVCCTKGRRVASCEEFGRFVKHWSRRCTQRESGSGLDALRVSPISWEASPKKFPACCIVRTPRDEDLNQVLLPLGGRPARWRLSPSDLIS